jgi:hypothetical protein
LLRNNRGIRGSLIEPKRPKGASIMQPETPKPRAGELLPAPVTDLIRNARQWLSAAAAIALIPWIVYLVLTLPANYAAHNWRATWVGFDNLLLMFMIATAVLGFLHRHLLTLAAFTTGVLLICDAWFDIMTAGPQDMLASVLTAVLGELPLAAILIGGTLRIVRLTLTRLLLLDPGTPSWRLPLFP